MIFKNVAVKWIEIMHRWPKRLTEIWSRFAGGKGDVSASKCVAADATHFDEKMRVEIRYLSDLTIERAKPERLTRDPAFEPYRFTLRPSRPVPPHRGYIGELSSGTKSFALPQVLSDGEIYDTYDQTYGVFPNVLAYTHVGCIVPTPGTIIYETDRAAAVWPRADMRTPGLDWIGENRYFDRVAARPGLRVDVPCLFTTHGSASAYGHWMSDVIPSVWLWREELIRGDVKLLMPYEQQPWLGKILDVLEIPDGARIQPEPGCYLVSLDLAIIAKSCSMGNIVCPPDVLKEIGEYLVRSVGASRERKGHRRLYLTRGESANWARPIVNEGDVKAKLLTLDFEVVNPAELSLLDQVRLFSEAAIIVSAHGSALVNLIFAPVGCTVIDLMPERWTLFEYSYRWIYRLTNILDQRYVLILLEGSQDSGGGDAGAPLSMGQPFSSCVDITALERAIRGCM